MTDHLTDARACVTSASQATDAGSAISWLTATCEQILDHLEAQNVPQEATSADLTASQPEPGYRDGGEAVQAVMAVLCDMGADSGGWHSWRCFDRLYPEPCDCTKQAARAAIAAAEPHIRAKTLAPIRAALADHPRCDTHPDDDPIKCGWERAVADIQAVLDREEQP